ncbi:MAG: hypothetical protein JWN75_913 [Candidatus Saccharibacteria bacterium]|nr:hypothetical protein [Candidatus Saccharibacteria bacterium]
MKTYFSGIPDLCVVLDHESSPHGMEAADASGGWTIGVDLAVDDFKLVERIHAGFYTEYTP